MAAILRAHRVSPIQALQAPSSRLAGSDSARLPLEPCQSRFFPSIPENIGSVSSHSSKIQLDFKGMSRPLKGALTSESLTAWARTNPGGLLDFSCLSHKSSAKDNAGIVDRNSVLAHVRLVQVAACSPAQLPPPSLAVSFARLLQFPPCICGTPPHVSSLSSTLLSPPVTEHLRLIQVSFDNSPAACVLSTCTGLSAPAIQTLSSSLPSLLPPASSHPHCLLQHPHCLLQVAAACSWPVACPKLGLCNCSTAAIASMHPWHPAPMYHFCPALPPCHPLDLCPALPATPSTSVQPSLPANLSSMCLSTSVSSWWAVWLPTPAACLTRACLPV